MKPCTSLLLLLSIQASVLADPIPILIKTVPAQMKYDRVKFSVPPGEDVIITLQNEDELPHNLVLCKPKADGTNDKGLEVATEAWNMGEAGVKMDWIPASTRIIAHTNMVNPHKSESCTFTAPEQAGEYPFVCTFPGHAMVMNGVMTVAVPIPPIKNLHYRYYVAREGQSLTKLPDLATLQSVEEGQLPTGKLDESLHYKERTKNFAYEFEGTLDAPKDGQYNFILASKDGSQLWIDGKEVIKNDGIHPTLVKQQKVKLTKGEHQVKVHYFQSEGATRLSMAWSGPGFAETYLSDVELNPDYFKTDKERFEGMPLVVKNEARIYRNFIAGCGPRAIAVGYPGGVNICWDADQMNVALVWQGAFMDAKRHWTSRGVGDQPPLGYGVAKLGQQRALGVLESPEAPWVPASVKDEPRNLDYTFRGYQLDSQRRPTFMWEYKGVEVTDFFEQEGDCKKGNAAIIRHITMTCNLPPSNLHFLALAGAVETAKGGAFILDKTVKVTIQDATPMVRKSAGRDEVLFVPIFKNGTAQFTMTYSWNLR